MLLLSTHIVQYIFILNLLTTFSHVELVFSSSGLVRSPARRTQSMKTYSHITELNQKIDSQVASTSSSSSSSSRSTQVNAKSKPLQTTTNEGESFKEIEIRPLIEEMDRESLHRLSVAQLSAGEASLATNGPINPARDGVRARVRKILQQNGVQVAVGSVIGAGGLYVGMNWFHNSNTSSNQFLNSTINTTTTTTTSTTQKARVIDDDADDIINPL